MISFDYPDNNRRQAYRISPGKDTLIQLAISGVAVNILDISVSGIAFKLDPGDNPFGADNARIPALLFAGTENHPMQVSLELVSAEGHEYRCKLHHHSLETQKRLSHFIVEHQKQNIRMVRRAKREQAETAGRSE